jgi:ribosome-associated toxin RatA of RatAB toxin-antitoxin module
MRTIRILVRVPESDAAAAFGAIADFSRFPALTEDVRSVEVHAGQPRTSDWAVHFRRGLLRWTERDSLDAAALRIEFAQTEGDFALFHGSWQVAAADGGCEVDFAVTYDFGIDSLAGIMDPIAERVIKRVICAVLAGLFGAIAVLDGGAALTDLSVRQG